MTIPVPQEGRRAAMDKSPDAFRTISEVAEDLDLPQHVLRFWETRFAQIKPLKRGGGRRYYRPDDVELLKGIRHLLYGEGYTIRGVQRILKDDGVRFVQAVGRGEQAVEAAPRGGPAAEVDGHEEVDAELDATEASEQPGRSVHDGHSSEEDRLPADLLGSAVLSRNDVDRLRAALDDLLECERLLSALKTPDDLDPAS